ALGEVRRYPDAGRAFSHQRRTGTGVLPLHAAGTGSQNDTGATGLGSAAPIAAAYHPERPEAQRISLVQTFLARPRGLNHLRSQTPPSCESRANTGFFCGALGLCFLQVTGATISFASSPPEFFPYM